MLCNVVLHRHELPHSPIRPRFCFCLRLSVSPFVILNSSFRLTAMPELFQNYGLDGFYDEMFAAPGRPRPHYQRLFDRFTQMGNMAELLDRQQRADQTFLSRGVTFTVYSDERGTEKIFPFDLIPRIVPAHEWARLEAGLAQRMTALNLFLADIYGPQRILREDVVPRHMVESSKHFRPEMVGLAVPRGLYVHINGTDLVRDEHGDYRVLEDNQRTASGVRY